MLHLPAERLAALADESPTRLEIEHLAYCAECRRERDAYLRVQRLACDESTRLAPAISDWTAIASALRAEGMLTTPDESRPVPAPVRPDIVPLAARRAGHSVVTWFSSATWARAAAALMLDAAIGTTAPRRAATRITSGRRRPG